MRVRVSDSESGCDFGNEQLYPLDEFIEANLDDAEFMASVPRLYLGDTVALGGGASPLYFIQLVD